MENSGQTRQPKVEVLLEECIRRKASDIHIQYGLPPILRIDGTLVPINGMPALNEEMLKDIIFATLDEEQQKLVKCEQEVKVIEKHKEKQKDAYIEEEKKLELKQFSEIGVQWFFIHSKEKEEEQELLNIIEQTEQ